MFRFLAFDNFSRLVDTAAFKHSTPLAVCTARRKTRLALLYPQTVSACKCIIYTNSVIYSMSRAAGCCSIDARTGVGQFLFRSFKKRALCLSVPSSGGIHHHHQAARVCVSFSFFSFSVFFQFFRAELRFIFHWPGESWPRRLSPQGPRVDAAPGGGLFDLRAWRAEPLVVDGHCFFFVLFLAFFFVSFHPLSFSRTIRLRFSDRNRARHR